MAAADEGQEACVQALLRAKANPDLQSDNGATALMLRFGHERAAPAAAKANPDLQYRRAHRPDVGR